MESAQMARKPVQAEEMLPLLKRHEIQVLLRAGHSQKDVAERTGASADNRVWVTDVTAIWTSEGWLYLAAMRDPCSRRVVGWATSANHDTALALDALRHALRTRKPPRGLGHHSDRGSPYASAEDRAELAQHGFVASMSRKGDCWDDAVAESFFGTLRAELVDREPYATRAAADASTDGYIGDFYEIERRHSYLGYVNPIEFELRSKSKRPAASSCCPRNRGNFTPRRASASRSAWLGAPLRRATRSPRP